MTPVNIAPTDIAKVSSAYATLDCGSHAQMPVSSGGALTLISQ